MLGLFQKRAHSLGSRKVAPSSVSLPSPAAPGGHTQRNVAVRDTAGWAGGNSTEKTMFGDNFGARDPTAGELESNFSDKVLGNWDTAHVIKIPEKFNLYLGVNAHAIRPTSELSLLEGKDLELLKNQTPGWRVVASKASGQQSVLQEWKGKDGAATAEIARLLAAVVQAGEPYTLASLVVQGDTVSVELSTAALGGLTENDFIVASRMNNIDVKALLAKKKARYWA